MIEVAVASPGLVCQPARKSAVWSRLRCSMFGIFSGYRRYIKTVGDCLRLLFVDFPPGTLAKLEGAIAIDAITAAMFNGKSMDAKQCAVMIARTLVGIFFSRLPDEEDGRRPQHSMRAIPYIPSSMVSPPWKTRHGN